MSAVLLFGIFFALLFLNVPIAMSLGVSSIITTMAVKPAMMSTIAANLYSSTNTYVLLAIPFFILAGNIMDVSGWGPDYGDPQSYLDTMLPDYAGYMVKSMGIF